MLSPARDTCHMPHAIYLSALSRRGSCSRRTWNVLPSPPNDRGRLQAARCGDEILQGETRFVCLFQALSFVCAPSAAIYMLSWPGLSSGARLEDNIQVRRNKIKSPQKKSTQMRASQGISRRKEKWHKIQNKMPAQSSTFLDASRVLRARPCQVSEHCSGAQQGSSKMRNNETYKGVCPPLQCLQTQQHPPSQIEVKVPVRIF